MISFLYLYLIIIIRYKIKNHYRVFKSIKEKNVEFKSLQKGKSFFSKKGLTNTKIRIIIARRPEIGNAFLSEID